MPGDLKELRSLSERVKTYVASGEKLNEANTKAALVEPMLGWLGWDIHDPAEVDREWKRKKTDEPADYALVADGEVLLILEAKPLSDTLRTDKGWKQLATSGLNAGVRWCARTNGSRVILVNLLHEAPLDEKVFWTVDLAELDKLGGMSAQEAADLLRLLSKEALQSGETERAWEHSRAESKARDAIENLLARPSAQLMNMVRERARDQELPDDVVARCLAECVGKEPALAPSRLPPGKPTPARKKRVTIADLLAAGLVEPGDRWRARYRGEDTFAEVASDGTMVLHGKRFTSPSTASAAVTGKSPRAGWGFWRFRDPDGNWKVIDELRKSLVAALAETAGTSRAEADSDAGQRSAERHLKDRPHSRPVYDALLHRLKSVIGDFPIHANSRHIVFSHRAAFAAIRVTATGLRVGLRLEASEAEKHSRLEVQPRGIFEGWSALHVSSVLQHPEQVDEELISLMQQAYDNAA